MRRSEYHIDTFGQLVADPIRTGAYAEALRRAVRPGSIVLDIGAGTGILTLLACKLGARRVHAIECDPVIDTAREIVAANGFADRVVFHEAQSVDVDLDERADVIVSDLYGALPLHRARIRALRDARQRLLAPSGVMIPSRDHLWIAVASAPDAHRVVTRPWAQNEHGFDMTAARDIAANLWRHEVLAASDLVSAPIRIATWDYALSPDENLDVTVTLPVARAAPVHGLCVWFDAEFVDGVGFSNAPGEPTVIYGSAFFPWPHAVAAEEGDEVRVRLRARLVDDRYVWSWNSAIHAAGEDATVRATFRQSTFYATALSRGALQRTTGEFAPGLGEAGRMDRLVLEEMARGATLGEIARQLLARFPSRFENEREALEHVSDLSARYGR